MSGSAPAPAATLSGGELCIPDEPSVTALFRSRAEAYGDRPALRTLVDGGADSERILSWSDWEEESRAVSAALVEEGIEPGDRLAVLAGNRLVWPVCDLGAVGAGALSVGLYPTSAPAQIREVLADCRARVAVVDTVERVERLMAARRELPWLERIVVDDAGAGRGDGKAVEGDDVISWSRWLARGREALARPGVAREVECRRSAPGPEDDAVLIYTSGSTGRPKGARLSHRYLLASAASIRETLGLGPEDRTLSYLPYCHAAERVFGLYTRILCGMEAGLVEDHRRLWDAARSYRPTVFGGLPRFFEKIHRGVREEGREVADYLGTDVRLATSGGASLKPPVVEGLREAGLTVLGAYGLTEHLCVAFNRPDRHDLTTAGPAMPGTDLRIVEDGEILVRRGALTFSGYLGQPDETREAFTPDGRWLRTGDLGGVEDGEFLRVTGRKKELLALSTGKKVAPLPVEERLASDPWIERAVLVGEGRKFVAALVVPRGEAPGEEIRRRIQEAVDRVNRDLSRTEQVREFAVLDRPLSAETGELTPTGKVRRFQVLENHAELIESLYAGTSPVAGEDAEDGEHGEAGRVGGSGDVRAYARRALLASALAVAAAYASAFLPEWARGAGSWLMVAGTAGSLVSAMALGAARDGRLGVLGPVFLFVFLVLAGGFGAALAVGSPSGGDAGLFLGLPAGAALVLYGVGLIPLTVVPLAYALTFDRMTLDPGDWERIRERARNGGAGGGGEANVGGGGTP